MTAPNTTSLDDGFIEAPAQTAQEPDGFLPAGSPMPAEEMDTILAEDKNLVLGMPKGADLDQINLNALTSIYQKPKEDFFLGIPHAFGLMARGAGADVMQIPISAAGIIRSVADKQDQPAAPPGQTKDWVFNLFEKLTGTKERPVSNDPLFFIQSDDLRDTADRLSKFSHDTIERFRLRPDSEKDRVFESEGSIRPEPVRDQFLEDLQFGVGQGAASMARSLALLAITKNPELIGGMFGIQMYGSKYEQYTQELGMDPDKALPLSILAGMGEGSLEALGLEAWMNALKGSKVVLRIAVRAGEEFLQEAAQQGSETLIDVLGAGIEKTPQQIAYEIGMAGLIGILVGAPAAGISAAFEENSYFGEIRKRYNLTDEQAGEILQKMAGRRVKEVQQHMAKKINEELAEAEIKIAKDGPPPVRVEVSPEDQKANAIVQLEEYRELRNELEILHDQTESPAQAQQFRQDLDAEIARLEAVLGVPPQEVRFSRKGQQDQVKSPAFKTWFGTSKVVAADGKPMRVYHGTPAQFSTFKTDGFTAHFGTKQAANDRVMDGESVDDNEGVSIMPVYLSIKNPLEFSDIGDFNDVEMWQEYLGPANYEIFTEAELSKLDTIEKIKSALIKKGYDGIKYSNSFEGEKDGTESYIAFYPGQIKSATGNRGTFDPKNPDIRFSRRDQNKLGFYSAAIRAIEDKMPKTATRQQVMNILKNTPGVKAAEVEAMDLYSFPEEGDMNAPFEKQALLGWMREHMVTIEEEILGGPDNKEYFKPEDMPKEIQYMIDAVDDGTLEGFQFAEDAKALGYIVDFDMDGTLLGIRAEGAKPTHHQIYRTKGGTDYQERLIKVPAVAITKLPAGYSLQPLQSKVEDIQLPEPVYQADLPASGWTSFPTKEAAEAASGGMRNLQRTVYTTEINGKPYKVTVVQGAYATGQNDITVFELVKSPGGELVENGEYARSTATRKSPRQVLFNYVYGESARWTLVGPSGVGTIIHGDLTEEEATREAIDRLLTDEQRAARKGFTHSHWPGKVNVAVHERGSTFKIGGKKIYVIHELQSDWSQKGRKEGWMGDPQPAQLKRGFEMRRLTEEDLESMDDDAAVGDWSLFETKPGGEPVMPLSIGGKRTKEQAIADLYEIANDAADPDMFFEERAKGTVPIHPLRDVVIDLALKRVLRWASDNGFDGIAVETGALQFERWGSEEIAWVVGKDTDSIVDPNAKIVRRTEGRDHYYVVVDTDGNEVSEKYETRSEAENGTMIPAPVGEKFWRISASEQVGGNAGGIDIEGEARARGILKEKKGKIVRTWGELHKIVKDVLSSDHSKEQINKVTDRVWARMQTEDAGTTMPRKEGLEYAYDKVIPTTLAKVAKAASGGAWKGEVGKIKISGTAPAGVYMNGPHGYAYYFDGTTLMAAPMMVDGTMDDQAAIAVEDFSVPLTEQENTEVMQGIHDSGWRPENMELVALTDREPFAGAEDFRDGNPPLTTVVQLAHEGRRVNAQVIVHPDGVSFFIEGQDSEIQLPWKVSPPTTQQGAASRFEALWRNKEDVASRLEQMSAGKTTLVDEKGGVEMTYLELTPEIKLGVQQGQALFARGAEGRSTTQQVEAKIAQLSKGMGNLPEILVFQTAEEAFMQTGVQIPDDAEAFFRPRGAGRDQIIMIAERLAPDKVAFVFYHELVGHYGLRSLFGVKFDSAMKDIYDKNQKIRTRANAIMAKYSEYDQATATEEALADQAAEMAKEKEYPSWWETVLSRLRALARNLGLDLELTDTDLNVILADARRMVEKKAPDTDLTAKQAIDAYNAAIHDADQAKAELEGMQDAIDFFRENKVKPTEGLEEDFKWKQIPRAFKAGKDEFGQTLDHLVKKIGQGEGERDSRIPEFDNEAQLAEYMIQLWQSYTYARARSRKPGLPRLRQTPTITSAAWLKRRNAVLRARQAGKQAGSDQVSYLMLKQDMRRAMSEEVLNARIGELKQRIRDIKNRTLAEREAARQGYYEKQADAKRAIMWKIQRKEAVTKSIEEYITDNLPVEKRGQLLKVARAAGISQKAIAKAFDRVQRAVDAYIRQQTIAQIKKLAQKAQAKSVAVDYRNAVDRIVEDLDFQKPTAQTRARLAKLKKYIDEKLAAGEDPGVGRDEYEALRRLEKVSVADLTQLDLLNIMDRIALLIRVGQTKRELLKNRWDTDKSAALDILRAEGRNLGKLGSKQSMIRTKIGSDAIADNTWQDIRAGLRKADWSLLPIDAFIDMLDGYKDYRGANYRIFKNRIDRSFQNYLDLKDRLVRPLTELGEKLKLTEENYYHIGVFAADEQEDGRKKLLAYAEDETEQAFLEQLIEEIKANMTAAEMKWYGEARQTLDALRPQIAQVMRKVYNKDLAEVKNYFPFMMNFDAMSDSEIENRFGDSVEMFGKKPKGDVKKGFTEERVGGTFKVRLNALDIMTQHLDNATYLVEMGESIKFLQEIAKGNDYKGIVGQDAQDFMTQWLSLLAKKGALKRDGGLDYARRLAGIYALGFRLSTGLIQMTALMDGATYIGPWVVNGMTKMTEDPWRKFILDNMAELRDRVGDDPAIAQLEFVAAPQNLADVVKVLQSKTTKVGYAHIRWMDSIVAQSVAGGAYLKYMADHKLELDLENPNQDAINYAQLVLRRTQASTFVKDLPAAISRGALTGDSVSWGKLVFQFQTFMLSRWSIYRNDILAAGIKGKRPEAINKLMILLMAAFVEVLLRRGVNIFQEGAIDMMRELMGRPPADDDDDDDSILEEWFSSIFRNVPIVGPAVDSLKYGSLPVPAIDILARPLETASALMRSRKPAAVQRNLTRLAVQSAGMVFGGGGQADQIVKQFLSD